MKKITFTFLALCLVFAVTFTSCKKVPPTPPPVKLTLKEKVQGATYILGNVTQSGANKNSDFTGFFIRFSADGNQVTVRLGGASSNEFTSNCSIGETTVTISSPPQNIGWTALSGFSTRDEDKPTAGIKFDVAIINQKTGSANFNFDLNKQ